jgi:hypothetical protein
VVVELTDDAWLPVAIKGGEFFGEVDGKHERSG